MFPYESYQKFTPLIMNPFATFRAQNCLTENSSHRFDRNSIKDIRMFRFKKSTFSLFTIVVACLLFTSCENEEPPISFASNPGFFTTWHLSTEDAICNQGGTYTGNSQNGKVELNILRDFTYEYLVDGEIIQSGTFFAQKGNITFSPPIHPNDIKLFSTYILTGPNLFITTTELFNPGSGETCTVKRTYGRNG